MGTNITVKVYVEDIDQNDHRDEKSPKTGTIIDAEAPSHDAKAAPAKRRARLFKWLSRAALWTLNRVGDNGQGPASRGGAEPDEVSDMRPPCHQSVTEL